MSEQSKELRMNTTEPKPDLVRCPLCGADKGYTIGTGDTYRWWTVCCGACGRQVDECRSDGNTSLDAAKPLRWPAADDVWNEAGSHCHAIRKLAERYRWLRDELDGDNWHLVFDETGSHLRSGIALDTAVDAALDS